MVPRTSRPRQVPREGSISSSSPPRVSTGAMDEILALQAALSAAQEEKSQIKLSERNIVELVNKLKGAKLLDDSLLYTLNGKEYVTQDRLRAEIRREVRRGGGRVPVVELQALLNVDVVHCERAARALSEDPSSGFSLVEGELMTPAYFDAVAAEVDEELREAGMVGVGDLARRHDLSAELMRKVLTDRIGTVVEGRLEGQIMYTPGYVSRLTAQLRGAMRAALTPTTRDALVTNALFADTPAGAELTGSIITDLAKKNQGAVDRGATAGEDAGCFVAEGVFRGGAWHPDVYTRAQTAAVAELYSRQGIVTVDEALRMGVDKSAQKKYFKDLDPTCVALEASFVSDATLEQLDATVAEVLTSQGWCEAEELVPGDLPPSDAPALLAMTQTVKCAKSGRKEKEGSKGGKAGVGNVRLVSELAVVTETWLDAAGAKARELGAEMGREEGKRRQLAKAARLIGGGGTVEGADNKGAGKKGGEKKGKGGRREGDSDAEDEDSGAGAGARRNKKGQKSKSGRGDVSSDEEYANSEFAIKAEDLDSDDDGGRGGKKGKKGKAGKKGGKGGSAGGPSAGTKKGGDKGRSGKGGMDEEDEDTGRAPSEDDLAEMIAEMAPEASEAFCAAVAKHVRPTAAKAFASAAAAAAMAAHAASRDSRKERKSAAAAALDELVPYAYLFARGAELLPDDIASQRHCAKTHCVPIADLLLRAQADVDLADDEEDRKGKPPAEAFMPLAVKEREAAVAGLPLDVKGAAEALAREATSCRSPAAIMAAFEALADALGMRLKGGDKKIERSLLHAHKKGLEERLKTEEQPATALMLALHLVLAVTKSRAVALTGRSLTAALTFIADNALLPAEETEFLKTYQADVMASLVESGDGNDVGSDEGGNDDGTGVGLVDRLPELRRVALECKKPKGGGGGDEE